MLAESVVFANSVDIKQHVFNIESMAACCLVCLSQFVVGTVLTCLIHRKLELVPN